jgi:hypothetical protein
MIDWYQAISFCIANKLITIRDMIPVSSWSQQYTKKMLLITNCTLTWYFVESAGIIYLASIVGDTVPVSSWYHTDNKK